MIRTPASSRLFFHLPVLGLPVLDLPVLGRRGVVSTETAILLPLLILLILGALDVARYVRVTATTDRVAVTVADLVTQCASVTRPSANPVLPCDMGTIFKAALQVSGDLGLEANGEIIVSSVGWYVVSTNPFGVQTVLWQTVSPYTETGVVSTVGQAGSKATLPAGQILPNDHNAIVAEVFVRFQPWSTLNTFAPIIARAAVFRPRGIADLRTIQ